MKNQIIILNTLVLASLLASVASAESTVPAKFGKALKMPTVTIVNPASLFDKAVPKNLSTPADKKPQKADFKSILQGGVNGGGGNSINHKMIEGYRRKISNMPGYHTELVMALNDLGNYFPEIPPTLLKKMNQLAWYVIPYDLSELPKEVTGLPFSTEQVAVQINSEVFISQSTFDAMTTKERTDLYIHETILGLHIDWLKLRNQYLAAQRREMIEQNIATLPADETVDPHFIRLLTNSILGKDYLSDPDSFIKLWADRMHVGLLTPIQIDEGKIVARKALIAMSATCENPDKETIQKIRQIGSEFRSLAGKEVDSTCGDLPVEECYDKHMRGLDSYDLALGPLSSIVLHGGTFIYDQGDVLCRLVKDIAQKNKK